MKHKHFLRLTRATKVTKRSKGTISKAISSGRLSYVEKNDNGYKIDASELFRVFPKKPIDTGSKDHLETYNDTRETAMKIIELEGRLSLERKKKKYIKTK